MKVRVVIEYEIPELDELTDSDAAVIENAVMCDVPGAFVRGEDDMFFAREFSVLVET